MYRIGTSESCRKHQAAPALPRVFAVHPFNVADNHEVDLELVSSETGYFGMSELQNAFACSLLLTPLLFTA
jgi:hypothetical protein